MCGIAGIIDKKNSKLEATILNMRDTFPWRGPDGKGHVVFRKDGVALGHRRLSILDLSPAGNQPMTDATETLTVVFNGEIYNYIELRQELESAGYRFRSGTDTEVLLAAYHKWGIDCLAKFNGMFTFAIWDVKLKKMFLARDRLGIKPLYYYFDGTKFIFASEIKSILKGLPDVPSINYNLVDQYMSFGYIPGENTLYSGIKRLLPGYYMVFHDCNLTIKKYWDLEFQQKDEKNINYYIERVEEFLNHSIDLRLRSDVPLGIFLSGGIDSSAVVALLAPRVNKQLKTFSVAYDFGSQFDETPYAKIVAQKFHTDHHEFFVDPKDFEEFIPRYVYYMDEPVTEAAAISLYFISQLAREHVTVVLSGEGSDELFAGYDFYFYNLLIEKFRSLLGHDMSASVARRANGLLPDCKIKKYLELTRYPLDDRYKGISTYEERLKSLLYKRDFKESLKTNSNNDTRAFLDGLFRKTQGWDPLSRMLYFDTKTWLVDDLLIKADRMSMAASIELRVPFLDYRLVEFAATIPSSLKVRGKTTKYLLKKMLEHLLPREIIYRKKLGFPTPLRAMFAGELAQFARELLLSHNCHIHKIFDAKTIKKIVNSHVKNEQDNHRIIWQLVVLETWFRIFTNASISAYKSTL